MEFSAMGITRMGLELLLGVCIKLLCDNGRIHWRDFVNDFAFWLPQQPGDGLSRSLVVAVPTPRDETDELPLAAK